MLKKVLSIEECVGQLQYVVMTGPEFQRASFCDPGWKYYHPPMWLRGEKDQRTFIFALLPQEQDEEDDSTHMVVGAIELQVSVYEHDVLWFKYISVLPEFKDRGISKRLIEKLIEHLKGKSDFLLEVSMYSDEGMLYFKKNLEAALDAGSINWRPSGT